MNALVGARTEGRVGYLRLDRPEKRNALNHALVADALAAVDRFVAEGVGVAVLEAAGAVFCAGADLGEATAEPPERAASERLLATLMTAPLFWVAAVSGPALGAGVAVVAVCPLALCADTAWFALPEIRLGLFPAGVMAYLEPALGSRRALELGLRERRWTATDALHQSLVNEVVPADRLADRVADWAAHLAAHPEVTANARAAWQSRFTNPAFVGRKAELDRLLEVPRARV